VWRRESANEKLVLLPLLQSFFYPKEVEKEMKGVMTIHIIPGKMPDEQRRIYFSECR